MLEALKDRIANAAAPDRDLDLAIHEATNLPLRAGLRFGQVPKYTSSVDDALALVERVLPDHDYIFGHTNAGLTLHCQLGPNEMEFGATAPLAILAALLSALISKESQS